jgi:cytochrome c oxidase subunit 4
MRNNPEHEHGGSKPVYNMVFLLLGVLTVIEVTFSGLELPDVLRIGALLALALSKAGLVVAFYMHLKYDPPMFTWILIVPLLMGLGVILSLQALAGY